VAEAEISARCSRLRPQPARSVLAGRQTPAAPAVRRSISKKGREQRNNFRHRRPRLGRFFVRSVGAQPGRASASQYGIEFEYGLARGFWRCGGLGRAQMPGHGMLGVATALNRNPEGGGGDESGGLQTSQPSLTGSSTANMADAEERSRSRRRSRPTRPPGRSRSAAYTGRSLDQHD